MIGWQASLGYSRRMGEMLAWAAALAAVLSLIAASAALAMIFDLDAGADAKEDVVMIDLPPVEAAKVLQDVPDPAPDVPMPELSRIDAPKAETDPVEPTEMPDQETPPEVTDPMAMQDPAPKAETLPDLDDAPPPPPVSELALAETPRPPDRPERPKPVQKTEHKTQEKPKAQPRRQQASKAATGGQTAAAGQSSPREIDRWKGRVQSVVQRHMARRRFEAGQLVLAVRLDSSGRITAASIARSSGNAGLDGDVLAYMRRIGRLPQPPAGAPLNLSIPVAVR